MRGAGYRAVLLTDAQIRELREGAMRWYTVRRMRTGPGRDERRANVIRRAIEQLDAALGDRDTFALAEPPELPLDDPAG